MNLKNEGKIGLVEPSEEIKSSYLIKSQSNLESAKILLSSLPFGHWTNPQFFLA